MEENKPVGREDIPEIDRLKEAVLQELSAGRRRSFEAVKKDAIASLKLTASQKRYKIKGSKTTLLENRFEKARSELHSEGLIEYPDTGKVKITEAGKALCSSQAKSAQVEEVATKEDCVRNNSQDDSSIDEHPSPQEKGEPQKKARRSEEGEKNPFELAPDYRYEVTPLFQDPPSSHAVLADSPVKTDAQHSAASWVRFLPLALVAVGLLFCLAGQGLLGAVSAGAGAVLGRKASFFKGDVKPAAAKVTFVSGLCAALLGLVLALSGACSGTSGGSVPQPDSGTQAVEQKSESKASLRIDAADWSPSYGSITVAMKGTTDQGKTVSKNLQVRPGASVSLECDPGTYTFTVDPLELTQSDAVFTATSADAVFDGSTPFVVNLAVVKDAEATDKLLTEKAEKAAAEEQAKAQAETEARAQEEAAAAAAAAAAEQNNSAERTVYITNTGGKYHRDGCRYLKNSKIAISTADARAQGYEPCKVCDPF